MRRDEFQNWKDFAFRFARTHYAKRQHPDLEELESDLTRFFDAHADSYERITCWIDVTDYVSELFDCVWECPYDYACERHRILLDELWGRDMIDEYDEQKEKIIRSYETPVHCCLRIGLDFITEEVGVLGFTAGDVQALYPEGVPDWCNETYTDNRDNSQVSLGNLPPDTPLFQ